MTEVKQHQKDLLGNLNIHIVVWLIVVITYSLFFSQFYPLDKNLWRTAGNIIPMGILFYINFSLIDYYLTRKKYFSYLVVVNLVSVVIAYIRVLTNVNLPQTFNAYLIINKNEYWWLAALLTNFSIIVISALIKLWDNRNQIERKADKLIQEQQQAQLQFLRAQINPHFLFNTLNNIYSMAVIGSNKTADMIQRLSSLLRYVIYESQKEMVSVANEIHHIKELIEIFQMRNEEPYNITFDITAPVRTEGYIEPMILIPIVENCLKHCDLDTNPEAFIQIDLIIEDNFLIKIRK
ncbi:MAG: histidine kinase, partial [Bacteroidota bacterium]